MGYRDTSFDTLVAFQLTCSKVDIVQNLPGAHQHFRPFNRGLTLRDVAFPANQVFLYLAKTLSKRLTFSHSSSPSVSSSVRSSVAG